MATKAYKKGDKVTVIGAWDRKGTVYYRDAVVHSCGVKQMTLTDEKTGVEIGRHFKPVRGSLETVKACNWEGVFPRMTAGEAVEVCLKAGALIVEMNHAEYSRLMVLEAGNRPYVKAMQGYIDALHEPRAMEYQPY